MASTATLAALKAIKCNFVRLETETTPALRVTDFEATFGFRPELVKKHSKSIVLLGTSVRYSKRCANHLAKVGSCDTKGTGKGWGVAVDGVHTTHKGQDYITAHFVSTSRPKTEYIAPDGSKMDYKTLKPFIIQQSGNAPIIRKTKLENVVGVKVGGKWLR